MVQKKLRVGREAKLDFARIAVFHVSFRMTLVKAILHSQQRVPQAGGNLARIVSHFRDA